MHLTKKSNINDLFYEYCIIYNSMNALCNAHISFQVVYNKSPQFVSFDLFCTYAFVINSINLNIK